MTHETRANILAAILIVGAVGSGMVSGLRSKPAAKDPQEILPKEETAAREGEKP